MIKYVKYFRKYDNIKYKTTNVKFVFNNSKTNCNEGSFLRKTQKLAGEMNFNSDFAY